MPGDTIDRIIFKVEIDGDAYIKGADALANSTNKLAQSQEAANKSLQENEAQLKKQSQEIDKAKKALDSYTGADETRRKQLEKSFQTEKQKFDQINKAVIESKKNFEAAKTAADNFNAASSKALNLQPIPGQGKIPTAAPIVPPVIQAPLKFQDFDLHDVLESSLNEFEQLRIVMGAAREKMASLNAEDAEFKLLAPLVEQGEEALRQYDDAAKDAGQSTLSLRTQIRLGKDELVKLEEAGKGATKEYLELEKKVAKLTDAFGDQQQRIRILASDTKLLDFGKSAITAATSAFQTYASIQILVGEGNEELQKKTMQLFAAMQLLQSLEQLSNLTRREGQLATLAQAGAQGVYNAVVGASTGALKAFRIALLATGIGAAIAAIGFLVIKYNEMRDATREAREEQKLLDDINKKAIEGFSQEVTHLELVRKKLDDLTIPQKERVKLAKEYNKTAEDANKIDLKQISNIDLVNAAIDRQIVKLKQRAIARAAEAVIGEKAEAFFKQQVEFEERFPQFSDKTIAELDKKAGDIIEIRKKALGIKDKVDNKEILAFADLPKEQLEKLAASNERFKILLDDQAKQRLASLAKQQTDIQKARTGADVLNAQGAATSQALLNKAKQDFDRALKIGAELIGSEDLIQDKTGAGDKIENVFEQERLKLTAQLAELRNKEITDLKKINDQFAAKLLVEKKRIEDLIKDKKITGSITDEKSQAGILFKIAVDINEVERDKAIADFNKKITDARKKLNDELRDLQEKNIQDQLNLIQDEFERRSALIDFNEKKELADQKEATDERIAALDLDRLLIGEQAYQDAKAKIIDEGEKAALNIQQKYAVERQDLAAASFKKILDAYQAAISTADLIRDEGVAQQIRNVSDRFLSGKISYEKFQQEITKIQKDAEATRRNATLETQRSELQALDHQIEQIKDKTSKEYKDLIKLRDELRGKIAAGEKEDAEKDAEDKKPGEEPRTKRILSYVDSIGQLAASVIGFWEKANEAESKALDRSIALQEKRVDAARRIAERGNAEYLKQEEDRLTELQIKRENAARRQLAIDAAIQGSQLLVGITGAIAKIASGIGAAETIAEIAVIVGALATGYGLVKSLQGNQPKLAKGDPYVRRGKNPSGTDTIPAWLNEGEAVIPTDTNKAYHPAVQAIYHKKVPAEDINRFVQNYHRLKPVPQVNHERIKNAAELHIDSSGKMAVAISEQNKLLMENNDLQRATIRAIRSIKNEVSLDKNGFAASFMEVVEQMEIDKKT